MSKPKKIAIKDKPYYGWQYEEQTKIKHQVLGSYTKVWISKLGFKSDTLFFDCHGGCGAYMPYSSSSPSKVYGRCITCTANSCV